MPSQDRMKAIVAQRFAPLDFSTVPGFPHPVPSMTEWGDFLPIFRERGEDNPANHLIKFHECMNLLDLQHEDVRMKMFMYSLDGDAREWYFSLLPSNISSLKDFHTVFHEHCKRYFSNELLFKKCCEEYELHDEDEIFSMATFEEDSQLIVDGKIHDYVIDNATTSNSY